MLVGDVHGEKYRTKDRTLRNATRGGAGGRKTVASFNTKRAEKLSS